MATILVVDDEPTIRVLVRAVLEGTAHRIVDAADGEHGLAIARCERPDLVLVAQIEETLRHRVTVTSL